MLHIAICDDDLQVLSHLSKVINRYQEEKKISMKYSVFSNAIELLEAMHHESFHVLLLDVLMPGMNGIQAAKEIRQFNPEIKIIFLTSSPEYAVESYTVDAYYYLMKPGTSDKLFPILNKLITEFQKEEEALIIKFPAGILRIPFHKLEFLEVFNKKLLFHLADGNVKELSGSLSEYEHNLLLRQEFIKVHRSYIVNMSFIQELSSKTLTTFNQQTIPISRLLYAQVREEYMQHLFIEKGVF